MVFVLVSETLLLTKALSNSIAHSNPKRFLACKPSALDSTYPSEKTLTSERNTRYIPGTIIKHQLANHLFSPIYSILKSHFPLLCNGDYLTQTPCPLAAIISSFTHPLAGHQTCQLASRSESSQALWDASRTIHLMTSPNPCYIMLYT